MAANTAILIDMARDQIDNTVSTIGCRNGAAKGPVKLAPATTRSMLTSNKRARIQNCAKMREMLQKLLRLVACLEVLGDYAGRVRLGSLGTIGRDDGDFHGIQESLAQCCVQGWLWVAKEIEISKL